MISRLRLFAGPNGAGKTTLSRRIHHEYQLDYGQYINPDDRAFALQAEGFGSEEACFIEAQRQAVMQRQELLQRKQSMTYESVMSHESHLDFVAAANRQAYRSYLYYIGVASPEMCLSRVRSRVASGTGHRVPEGKIAPRYQRSLEQLPAMCRLVRRAFLFDNSGDKHVFIGEITPEQELKLFRGEIASVGGAAWLIGSLVANWPEEKIRWEP